MEKEDLRAELTVIDEKADMKTTIPLFLSLPVIQLLVEDAMTSDLTLVIKPVDILIEND